jgi:hypothetical protein
MPFDAPPHSTALNGYRRQVFAKLFPNQKLPKPLKKDLVGPKAFAQNKAWDADMENITGFEWWIPARPMSRLVHHQFIYDLQCQVI